MSRVSAARTSGCGGGCSRRSPPQSRAPPGGASCWAEPLSATWPAVDEERRGEDLRRITVLVQRRHPDLDDSLPRPRARWPQLDDLALDAQLIAGPHRLQPAQLAADPEDAAGRA